MFVAVAVRLTGFVVALLLAMAPAVARAEGSPPRVGKWARFERAFAHDRDYADPYADVSLDVVLHDPSGGKRQFWGFYDGDQTWRLRFMPDTLGTWRYEARFSDGSAAFAGEFRCVPSDLPGMVDRFAPNPLWFGFRGGGPLLVRSFHLGDRFFADNYPAPARRRLLDWLQANGYNTLSIASHYLNRQEPGRGEGWKTPALWPLEAAEYRKAERILDDLAARRLVVFPFAGFFGKRSDFPREPALQERYVRYVLARFGAYWNVLLNVAGPEPNLKKEIYLESAEVERLGRLIKGLDPYGHLLTVHNRTGDDPYRESDWLDFGTLQGPKTIDREKLYRGLLRNHHPTKPLYAQETLWTGNEVHQRALGGRDYDDEDLRKNAIVINMAAASLNFADNRGNSSTGFSGTLALRERDVGRHRIIKRVWDLFASLPVHHMRPCPELVSEGAAFCLGDVGRDLIVYLHEGGRARLDLPEDRRYELQWINPRSARRTSGAFATDGAMQAPGPGDWLARVRATTNALAPRQAGGARPARAR